MGSPKAQQEFVVGLELRYPWLIDRIATAAGIRFPERDRLEAGPTAHRIKGGGRWQRGSQTLIQFFNARRDLMPAHAITEIINCSDAAVLDHWLERAFNGQTAEEIFR